MSYPLFANGNRHAAIVNPNVMIKEYWKAEATTNLEEAKYLLQHRSRLTLELSGSSNREAIWLSA
jgi:hypothetical protein